MFSRPAASLLAIALAVSAGAVSADDLLAPLVDNPICQPTGPSQGGGDQAYPTCGRWPDLGLDVGNLPGMGIGGVFVPWYGKVTLADTKATVRSRGRCGFPFVYLNTNVGVVPSVATTNAIFLGTNDYPVLAMTPLPALAPGGGAVSSGTVWLSPGFWTLIVKSDATSLVSEPNENNNVRPVLVNVTGSCE